MGWCVFIMIKCLLIVLQFTRSKHLYCIMLWISWYSVIWLGNGCLSTYSVWFIFYLACTLLELGDWVYLLNPICGANSHILFCIALSLLYLGTTLGLPFKSCLLCTAWLLLTVVIYFCLQIDKIIQYQAVWVHELCWVDGLHKLRASLSISQGPIDKN